MSDIERDPVAEPGTTSTNSIAGPFSALACGVLSSMAAWVSVLVAPWAARRAVARLNYDNVYTIPIAVWSFAVVLGLAAVVLGGLSIRGPAARGVSGAAVALGASSILGVAVFVIGTWDVMPRLG